MVDDGIVAAVLDPVGWIERNFWLRTPLDPETGELLGPGPLRLLPFQRGLLRAALEWDAENGRFRWQTIVWSTPKKTGKTTIAAAVTLWYAFVFPGSEVILLANDGRQASDRVFAAIRQSLELHPVGGARVLKSEIRFGNGTVIFPMPVDAAGASGANPALTVFTEVWAYTTPQKHQLWSELTPPPTVPNALRWVESYSGITGTGSVLELLYKKCTETREFLRIPDAPGHTVMVDRGGRIFYYYDHGLPAMHRFGWQTDEYFTAQRATLPPSDFERFHLNEWVARGGDHLAPEWFANCIVDDALLDEVADRPIVLGVDVGIVRAGYAVVGVTKYDATRYIVTDALLFLPGGFNVNLPSALDAIVSICKSRAVVEVAYDPYQFESDAQRLRQNFIAFANPFQQRSRGIADAGLVSAFQSNSILIPRKYEHLFYPQYSNVIWSSERRHFVPVRQGRIDLIVALSMALARSRYYSLD